jgi:hypothetical protein
MVQLTGAGWGISVIEGGEFQKSRATVVGLALTVVVPVTDRPKV